MSRAQMPKVAGAENPSNGKYPRRKILDPGKKRKVTICLKLETDIGLTVIAKMMGCKRSEIAEDMIRRGLEGIELSVKGKDYGSDSAPDKEVA
jgi:hypothetical protein